MDADGNSHEHVLWSLNWSATHSEQVGSFECLESEEIIGIVSFVVDPLLYLLMIVHDDLIDIICK